MKHLLVALTLLILTACVQRPAPVSSETASVDPADRLAIAVEYVAVPKAIVYARPAVDAPVVDSFGLTEAVSVLEKNKEWCLVRTFSGSGWVKQSDLVAGNVAETMDTTTPRFYVLPAVVPAPRTRGEILMQAKVNTDGEVVEVKLLKNTTGSDAIAKANSDALKAAKFYPMVDKGQHKSFVYEHNVYY
jgi:outer membrane biosynthesis protein TonB